MKLRAIITMTLYAILVTLASWWMAKVSYNWFPPEAAAEARLHDDLFSIFVGLGTFIYLGVMGPFVYSLIFHRAGKYDASDGPPIEGNATLEIIWTAVPLVLVLGLSTASYQTYQKMAIRGPMELVHLHVPAVMESAYAASLEPAPTPQETMETIDVTARQWAWVFHYPEKDVTSTELHLPADRRVKLVLRSEDVLHGFFIPAFRLKQDVVPNHTIDFEFTPIRPGKYRLRDSMFSGTYFAANQADVVVEPEAEYQNWLASAANQAPTPAFNQAAFEYKEAKQQSGLKGWKSLPPAPPPMVNFASQPEPTRSPT